MCSNSPVIGGPIRAFRIRTITAGLNVDNLEDLSPIRAAITFLEKARAAFEMAGYEIQTVRIATQPLPEYLPSGLRKQALAPLTSLDSELQRENVLLSLGPALVEDRHDRELVEWVAQLLAQTTSISLSVAVALPGGEVFFQTARTAAEAILAVAQATPDGEGNFRFSAAANCPAATPFFPVAFHQGRESFGIGLESAGLVLEAFRGAHSRTEAKSRLRESLQSELLQVEELARRIAGQHRRDFSGIDVSPAPGLDASIGEAVESLSGVPFGSPSTLTACADVTEALREVQIRKCGYCGLMLPVLEDRLLARRAAEGRFGIQDLLLFSSVCGTGLDVVPLAGDTSKEALTALISDVAALSRRLQKPLAARLLPIPGKKAGEAVEIENPYLTDSVALRLG